MDWNGDGKCDWQDDAFYNSVISPSKDENLDVKNSNDDSWNNSKPSFVTKLIIVLLVVKILEWLF